MPRTNSRKRNNHHNGSTVRVSAASNLSPNAPEFIPLVTDETVINQREFSAIQPLTYCGSSSAPNSYGNASNSEASNSSILCSFTSPGQRDLLIDLLNNAKVDCVICYERTLNTQPIWNCRNCFQIMHLRCIMIWYIKSNDIGKWRCPACQNECFGKPNYMCFCGALSSPFSNNVDLPHSCGQVCGLDKKNSNLNYNDCRHKCTLLCHPGPCPQCVVQVLRKCGCTKTEVYVQCGQSAPVLCQNICMKQLDCKNHICEKPCHADKCEPCKQNCPQNAEAMETNESDRNPQIFNIRHNALPGSINVSDDELRMLDIDPSDRLLQRTNNDVYNDDLYFDDDEGDDDDDDDEESDFDIDDDQYDDIINFEDDSYDGGSVSSGESFNGIIWPQNGGGTIFTNDLNNQLAILADNFGSDESEESHTSDSYNVFNRHNTDQDESDDNEDDNDNNLQTGSDHNDDLWDLSLYGDISVDETSGDGTSGDETSGDETSGDETSSDESIDSDGNPISNPNYSETSDDSFEELSSSAALVSSDTSTDSSSSF